MGSQARSPAPGGLGCFTKGRSDFRRRQDLRCGNSARPEPFEGAWVLMSEGLARDSREAGALSFPYSAGAANLPGHCEKHCARFPSFPGKTTVYSPNDRNMSRIKFNPFTPLLRSGRGRGPCEAWEGEGSQTSQGSARGGHALTCPFAGATCFLSRCAGEEGDARLHTSPACGRGRGPLRSMGG